MISSVSASGASASVQGATGSAQPTAAKQSVLQRVEDFLKGVEGDIVHDEEALVAFLKAHL